MLFQVEVGRLLIIMFIPQIFCYGIVGTATAVMNSRQRFALAAGAPAVENVGTIRNRVVAEEADHTEWRWRPGVTTISRL